MTVRELSKALGCEELKLPEPDREVEGCYCGDLLSWVMGRAQASQAWITIMSNINIVAVATLCDVSCIILSENVMPDDGVLDVAEAKGVNILRTADTTFGAAAALARVTGNE